MPSPLIIGLCLLAILSMLALDFLSSRKGGRSYIFQKAKEKVVSRTTSPSLLDEVKQCLASSGFPTSSLIRKASPEPSEIRVETDPEGYKVKSPNLENRLRARGIAFQPSPIRELFGKTSRAWRIQRGSEKLTVDFGWTTPMPAPVVERPRKEPEEEKTGRVALIVDDMGNNLEVLNELLSLGEPVTVSILPFSSRAVETAEIAHGKGLEVLLHLPLESMNNHDTETATGGIIRSGMSEDDIRRIMTEDLDRVPFIAGVNNHMGSRVTADGSMMRFVLEPIGKRGLFFLDSRTSSKSVAFDMAREMGIPTSYRNVFLDADGDGHLVKERLFELFRLARKNGSAIGICHPFRGTLDVLKENFRKLREYGLRAVPVSELVVR